MIVYAAIDLLGGRSVQLVGGRPGTGRHETDDPLALVPRFQSMGFGGLHVIDLDGALGRGDNRELLRAILAASVLPVQAGGGVRSDAAAAALLELGAARVIVGTRAIEDAGWLERLAARHPGRIVVAADADSGRLLLRGWTGTASLSLEEFVDRLSPLPLGGLLVTDVSREGRMPGIDRSLFEPLVRRTPHPLIAAGGIRAVEDLRTLREIGAAGAILGMALHTGVLGAGPIREYSE